MVIILGIVLGVMVVMNGALFYVLYTAVSVTGRQVSSCFVQELEDYSDFLKEKQAESEQIEEQKNELKKEIEEMEGVVLSLKTSPFYAPRPISRELYIPTARYIDNEFFDNHKRVNDMMKDMDQEEIIRQIRKKYTYMGDRKDYESAGRLLDFLDMDTAYELCTISPEEQLDALNEALEGREKEILQRFLDTLGEDEEFDVLNFRTFIREIRTAQDPRIYIRTGDKPLDYIEQDEDLIHQYDSNISEGLKVIYQNQSYDFSIYRLRSKK